MSGANLTDLLTKAAAFDVNQECGFWEVPIDDVDGELALDPERVARRVGAYESEPIDAYLARLQPILSALAAVAVAAEKHIDKCPEASRVLLYGDLLSALAALRKVCGVSK